MNRVERASAISRGVGAALLKRAIAIGLGLIVLQLLTVQVSINTGGDRQQKEANLRLERALKENKAEHAKTQQYVRCLIGIVLRPFDERPEDPQQALDTCGAAPDKTSAASENPVTVQPSPDTARTLQPTTGGPPDSTNSDESVNPQSPEPTQSTTPRLVSPLVQPVLDLIEGLGL